MFSVVKMMKEQGNQFDWSQIAIDIPSLPCFDQSKIESLSADKVSVGSILADGYSTVGASISAKTSVVFVVKVTGDNPSASFAASGQDPVADDFTFTDCEPVKISSLSADDLHGIQLVPVRALMALQEDMVLVVDSSSVNEFMLNSGFGNELPAFPLLMIGSMTAPS